MGPETNLRVGLHDFTADHEDEISFREGECIVVIEKDEVYNDGWWQGRNEHGDVGLFPVNFTGPYEPPAYQSRSPSATHSIVGDTKPYDALISSLETSFRDSNYIEDSRTPDFTQFHHDHAADLPTVPVATASPAPSPMADSPHALESPVSPADGEDDGRDAHDQADTAVYHDADLSGRPETWSIEQVAAWLHHQGFGSLVPIFIENEISGDVLLDLNLTTLKELQISTFGKRYHLMNAIGELRGDGKSAEAATAALVSPTSQTEPSSGLRVPQRSNTRPPSALLLGSGPTLAPVPADVDSDSEARSTSPSAPATAGPATTTIQTRADSIRRINNAALRRRNTANRGEPTATSPSPPPPVAPEPVPSTPEDSPSEADRASQVSASPARLRTTSLTHPTDEPEPFPAGRALSEGPLPPVRISEGRPRAGSRAWESTPGEDSYGRGRSYSRSSPPPLPPPPPVPAHAYPNASGPPAAAATTTVSGAADLHDPDHQGYLRKRAAGYPLWQARWFVLKGQHLYYFKHPHDGACRGVVNLQGYRMVPDENIKKGKYCFKCVHETRRTYYFYHDEAEAAKGWMKMFLKATIGAHAPITASSNIATVPLHVAQGMRPRPPSLEGHGEETDLTATIPHDEAVDDEDGFAQFRHRPTSPMAGSRAHRSSMTPDQFARWINHVLNLSPTPAVLNDVFIDLRDGRLLLRFVEALAGRLASADGLGIDTPATVYAQRAFEMLQSLGVYLDHVPVEPADIVEGDPEKTLAMLTTVRDRFPNSVPSTIFSSSVI
ncbi:hypothetical protein IWQ60_011867 [Tieghemiomyces parasiticus]|uniref:Uncharacterized protein n=1 Tax=Tieghemiomyces parasiticus TaxID=78921 RepID=A0A9W8DGX0_9FUNG|nr:hypothetical protein IWQ60_011867 [Tieghemiomyces parasiticus]